MKKAELSAMKVAELRLIAKERSLKGTSKMNKEQLVDAIVGSNPKKVRAIAEDGKYEKSGKHIKVEESIAKYAGLFKENGFLTPHQARILANAQKFLEDKGAKALFKYCQRYLADEKNNESQTVVLDGEECTIPSPVELLLGEGTFPAEFGAFCQMLPAKKRLFSVWDALGVISQCNKKAAHAAKAMVQQQKQDASYALNV